jgi:integrase
VEQEKCLKLLAKLTTPQFVENEITTTETVYTLQEWFDEWLTSYKGNLRAVTSRNYRILFETHCAEIIDLPLPEITSVVLAKVINTMNGCKQAKDSMKSLLKQMFSIAHNEKLIESNPTLNLPRPKATPPIRARKALTPEQEQRFIKVALTNKKYEPLLICLLQGTRKGEMLALRPNDLDFDKNTLRIDESFDEQNPTDLLTKNTDSNRIMPMFELTRKILLKYKDHDPNKRIYGNHYSTKLYKAFYELQEKADLPKLCIHELRHTFITRCHEKKIDEMIVQRWVGHQIGSRMTKAVYTHISNDQEKEYIKLLNNK